MELLEAYKTITPSGDTANIYEFRGRRFTPMEVTNETGQLVMKLKRGKRRSVHVAAENLFDATAHLRVYRPEFFPNKVMWRGQIKIENS